MVKRSLYALQNWHVEWGQVDSRQTCPSWLQPFWQPCQMRSPCPKYLSSNMCDFIGQRKAEWSSDLKCICRTWLTWVRYKAGLGWTQASFIQGHLLGTTCPLSCSCPIRLFHLRSSDDEAPELSELLLGPGISGTVMPTSLTSHHPLLVGLIPVWGRSLLVGLV